MLDRLVKSLLILAGCTVVVVAILGIHYGWMPGR